MRQAATRPLDSTLDFMRLLWSVENRLQSTSKRMEMQLGVRSPQRLVLKVVAQSPGISPKDVADVVRLHPSTITGILQRLTAKGLIARTTEPADRRRARLVVRSAARRYTRLSRGTIEFAVARALGRLNPPAVRAARRVLADIEIGRAHV